VVDDEPGFLKASQKLLGDGYEVVVLTSAKEAFELIRRTPPDVILCDYVMPEMNGRELHDAVAAHDPSLAERFVFVTGVMGDELLRFAKSAHREILHKPVSIRDLRAAIAGVIAGSAATPA
jgi:CheY-like chemotaxis protein